MTKCWKEILNLILKPLRRNSEIQECDLNRHLGSEVRVAQLGNEVEPEIWIVLDHGVPDQDAVCKAKQSKANTVHVRTLQTPTWRVSVS